MGCSLPGFSVCGISQARIQEWVAISFSRRSSWPRDQTYVSCIGRWVFVCLFVCFTTEPPGKLLCFGSDHYESQSLQKQRWKEKWSLWNMTFDFTFLYPSFPGPFTSSSWPLLCLFKIPPFLFCSLAGKEKHRQTHWHLAFRTEWFTYFLRVFYSGVTALYCALYHYTLLWTIYLW